MGGSKRPKILPYDFANPVQPITKKPVVALDFIHQLFASHLQKELPSEVCQKVAVISDKEQELIRYSQWAPSIKEDSVISVIKNMVGKGPVMVSPHEFNYLMLAHLLGSGPKNDAATSSGKNGPTKLEQAMFVRVHEMIMGALDQAWRRSLNLGMSLNRLEVNPKVFMLWDAREVVVTTKLELLLADGNKSKLTIAYPYSLFEDEWVGAGLKKLAEGLLD